MKAGFGGGGGYFSLLYFGVLAPHFSKHFRLNNKGRSQYFSSPAGIASFSKFPNHLHIAIWMIFYKKRRHADIKFGQF